MCARMRESTRKRERAGNGESVCERECYSKGGIKCVCMRERE